MSRHKETLIREAHSPLHLPQLWVKIAIVVLAFVGFFLVRGGLPIEPVPEGFTGEGVRIRMAILLPVLLDLLCAGGF